MLETLFLELLLLHPIHFWLLCFHFHLPTGFFLKLIYLLLAVIGLHDWVDFPLVAESGVYSSLWCMDLPWWPLLWCSTGSRCLVSVGTARGLENPGSTVVEQLSCSKACGIFLDKELNLCLMYWQADSLPLSRHQFLPPFFFFFKFLQRLIGCLPTFCLAYTCVCFHPPHLSWILLYVFSCGKPFLLAFRLFS